MVYLHNNDSYRCYVLDYIQTQRLELVCSRSSMDRISDSGSDDESSILSENTILFFIIKHLNDEDVTEERTDEPTP